MIKTSCSTQTLIGYTVCWPKTAQRRMALDLTGFRNLSGLKTSWNPRKDRLISNRTAHPLTGQPAELLGWPNLQQDDEKTYSFAKKLYRTRKFLTEPILVDICVFNIPRNPTPDRVSNPVRGECRSSPKPLPEREAAEGKRRGKGTIPVSWSRWQRISSQFSAVPLYMESYPLPFAFRQRAWVFENDNEHLSFCENCMVCGQIPKQFRDDYLIMVFHSSKRHAELVSASHGKALTLCIYLYKILQNAKRFRLYHVE